MEILKVNDIVYDEDAICKMLGELDLSQLEYVYDVLSLIIDQRVIEGDHVSYLNEEKVQ